MKSENIQKGVCLKKDFKAKIFEWEDIMKIIHILLLIVSLAMGAVYINCSTQKDEDSMPCMCFQNDSSSSVSGIRYRVSGSSVWIPKYFDTTQYSGDGFDCSEGEFDTEIDEGTYDFQIIGGSTQTWLSVPYDGGNVGFVAASTLANSLYGSVDNNCNPDGTIYSAVSNGP